MAICGANHQKERGISPAGRAFHPAAAAAESGLTAMHPAVFLDRDGVLIQDVHLLTRPEQIVLLPGVVAALRDLSAAGFYLFVVSNQPVVARGMATEADVESVHAELQRRLTTEGGPVLKRFYFCPHHPNATLPQYRV